jgi:outer membrane protein TolC
MLLASFCALISAAPRSAQPHAASPKTGNTAVSPSDGAAKPDSALPPANAAAPADTAPSIPKIVLDLSSVEKRSQEIHPILLEKKLAIDKSEQSLHELEMSAVLPKLQVSTLMGPAPGLRTVLDTTSLRLPDTRTGAAPGSTLGVRQNQKEFDFTEWGPFFGVEFEVVQPLNVSRYRAGKKAATYGIKVSEAEFQKERMDVSEEAQRLYYNRIYAGTMVSILEDAAHELDGAQKKMQNMLDEGDKDVKQTDLLELKAGRFTLEKGRSEARLGVQRTELGLRFLLQLPDSLQLVPTDTVLTLRSDYLPSLDSLKILTLRDHPDLKRLYNGLAAREELLRVAKGEVGPDIFLYGNFRYTKAWSTDRESGGNDPFARDPLNEITGVGGLGMRLQLNFWQRYEKVRKEGIELQQLRRTEAYAARGLLIKMQDEYVQMLKARNDVNEAQKSLRAAEAWLKAAAMKYDLDPSSAKDMISPYKTAIGARRDYYQAVLDYNLAFSHVLKAIGWTLSDYFHNFVGNRK